MHSSPNDVPVDDRAFGILRRMGSRRGIDAFLDQAKGARFCSRPVRLKGKIEGPDAGPSLALCFWLAPLPFPFLPGWKCKAGRTEGLLRSAHRRCRVP
jgi:hypothetical protein